MARSKAPDVCIFCNATPCACGKPVKKAVHKVAQPKPHVAPPVVVATDNQMAQRNVRARVELTDAEALEVYALQSLSPLMTEAERFNHMTSLNTVLSSDEKAAVWRLCHLEDAL